VCVCVCVSVMTTAVASRLNDAVVSVRVQTENSLVHIYKLAPQRRDRGLRRWSFLMSTPNVHL